MAHPHSYPWHEGHTALHQEGVLHHYHPDRLGAKYSAPYGHFGSGPYNNRAFPLNGYDAAVNDLASRHGYIFHDQHSFGNHNYNTKHLHIRPTNDSYTDNWRKLHELSHALTQDDINQGHGDGRRMGRLGEHRTLRESKRAVEWEWAAMHKMRDLMAELGVNVNDQAFSKELNTVIHDALYRLLTGKYIDPVAEGFRPNDFSVPISVANDLLDQASKDLGLKHKHELSKKERFCRGEDKHNLTDTSFGRTMSTKKEIASGLNQALRKALEMAEEVRDLRKKEAVGRAKLEKAGPGPGIGENSVNSPSSGGDMVNVKMEKTGIIPGAEAGSSEPDQGQAMALSESSEGACRCGATADELGTLSGHKHYLCLHCGSAFSKPDHGMEKDEFIDTKHDGDRDKRNVHIGEDNSGLDEKSKEVSAEGSGGLEKSKRNAPLPGMTPVGGVAKPPITQDVADSLAFIRDQGAGLKKDAISGKVAPDGNKLDAMKAKAKAAMASPSGKPAVTQDVADSMAFLRDQGKKPVMSQDSKDSLGWLKDQGNAVKAGATPDSLESLDWLQGQGAAAKQAAATPQQPQPIGSTGGRPVPFERKPAATDFPIPKVTNPNMNPNLKEAGLDQDKKAAGIGFLHNLITKFKGAGQKNWENLTGGGGTSAAKVGDRMGRRMAMAEKDMDKNMPPTGGSAGIPGDMVKAGIAIGGGVTAGKGGIAAGGGASAGTGKVATPTAPTMGKDEGTSVAQANKEIGGFKSIASNPTAMPKMTGIRVKTSAGEANKEIGGFKSIASSPTAMPQMAGIKKGRKQ